MVRSENGDILYAVLPVGKERRSFIDIIACFSDFLYTGYDIGTVQSYVVDSAGGVGCASILLIGLNNNVAVLKEFYRMSSVGGLPFQLEAKTQIEFLCLLISSVGIPMC